MSAVSFDLRWKHCAFGIRIPKAFFPSDGRFPADRTLLGIVLYCRATFAEPFPGRFVRLLLARFVHAGLLVDDNSPALLNSEDEEYKNRGRGGNRMV